ncbi:MAG: hypothetical protein ETSY1_39045 [Candidatus Entotheonella factor]|uniref:DUF1850 domain-containing protein n=1 Tax=Entotheonella factor TaxID=1429438 RepID=W4L601_ENTF1|nr:MAG: hypothetical protein ETSY1_39045 [Candidatus Entotheonella factor]
MTMPTRIHRFGLALLCLAVMGGQAIAGQVEIVHTQFISRGGTWQVYTTLRHGDTGWEHYADAWRVVTETGDVLGTRTLFHPHVDEQPFTRFQGGIMIPADTHIVYVEAHDKEHGWSPQRVQVDLRQAKGERFTVQRKE